MEKMTDGDAAYQTMRVLWVALFVSQLLFLLLIFLIKPGFVRFDLTIPVLSNNAVVVIALSLLGVGSFGFSLIQARAFRERAVAEKNVGLVQTGMIVGCALCELISLFGLFLAMAFDYQYFYLFIAFGMFAMLFHFPDRTSIDAALSKSI